MDTTSAWSSPLGEAIGPYLVAVLIGVMLYLGYKGLFPKKLPPPSGKKQDTEA